MTLLSPEETMLALRADYETAVCVVEELVRSLHLTADRKDDAFICTIQALYQRRVERGEMKAQA